MPLYRLIYHSRSRMPCGGGVPLQHLGGLLTQCLTHNPAHAITGVLAFDANRFIQMIEGPEAAIDRLFANIRRDPRHDRIVLALREPCGRRVFATWAIAFVRSDPRLPGAFARLAASDERETALAVVGTLAEIVS